MYNSNIAVFKEISFGQEQWFLFFKEGDAEDIAAGNWLVKDRVVTHSEWVNELEAE